MGHANSEKRSSKSKRQRVSESNLAKARRVKEGIRTGEGVVDGHLLLLKLRRFHVCLSSLKYLWKP